MGKAKTGKKAVAKKAVAGERVKKADTVLGAKKTVLSLIEEHDARSLTSHERLYDNEIIRNSLSSLKPKKLDVSQLNLNLKYKNTEPNKKQTRELLKKAGIKKGDVVAFASRNSDTKTGNMEKLVTFVTSNRLSALKKIECEDTFVFYVNK